MVGAVAQSSCCLGGPSSRLGLSFSSGKGEMGIAIETQAEIPNPMYSTQGLLPSHPDQAAPVMLPAKGTYAVREPGTSSRRGREASRLKLLLLVRASWCCQLPACEPDSLPSCAPQPSTKVG